MQTSHTFSNWKRALSLLSDDSLWSETRSIARSEREWTAWLVAHLAEVYRRDLALQRGYPSVTHYARAELGLTDAMAWDRIRAARLALELPEVIERIACGELTLSAAGELWRTLEESKDAPKRRSADSSLQSGLALMSAAPTLNQSESRKVTQSEKKELLQSVLGKTRQESEVVLREWKQERAGIKELPKPRPHAGRKHHSKEWTELELFLNAEELAKLDRLRDLLSHRLGTRDPNAVMGWLLELGLEKVDPIRQEERAEKRAKTRGEKSQGESATTSGGSASVRPDKELADDLSNEAPTENKDNTTRCLFPNAAARKNSTRVPIPPRLKRKIWKRDQGKCQFTDVRTGRICGSTSFLDCDHVIEVRNGGENSAENLRLVCASHNRRRHLWAG